MGQGPTLENGQILREVRRILVDEIQVEVPSDETDLIDSGILDSLTFVDLLYHVERTFQVSIDITKLDLDDLRSVERIARFVERSGAGR